MRPIILSAILLLVLPTSNANAGYIYDIFDGSSNDIGTLEFALLTGANPVPIGGVTDASVSLGGFNFSLPDLVEASWSIDPFTLALSGISSFRWGSPTFGTYADGGYDLSLSFNELRRSGSGYNVSLDCIDACSTEFRTVLSAGVGTTMRLQARTPPTAVSEPSVIGLFALGLAGLGFTRRKKLNRG